MKEKEEIKGLSLHDKICILQAGLEVPKSQYNSFSNFKYRNCEDIYKAVKPLLTKLNLILNLTDEIVLIGDRFYVKSVATISDGAEAASVIAYAREDVIKKGMDVAQITGAASSYARKYALNGLLILDDSKDVDSQDNSHEAPAPKIKLITKEQISKLHDFSIDIDGFIKWCKVDKLEDVSFDVAEKLIIKKEAKEEVKHDEI